MSDSIFSLTKTNEIHLRIKKDISDALMFLENANANEIINFLKNVNNNLNDFNFVNLHLLWRQQQKQELYEEYDVVIKEKEENYKKEVPYYIFWSVNSKKITYKNENNQITTTPIFRVDINKLSQYKEVKICDFNFYSFVKVVGISEQNNFDDSQNDNKKYEIIVVKKSIESIIKTTNNITITKFKEQEFSLGLMVYLQNKHKYELFLNKDSDDFLALLLMLSEYLYFRLHSDKFKHLGMFEFKKDLSVVAKIELLVYLIILKLKLFNEIDVSKYQKYINLNNFIDFWNSNILIEDKYCFLKDVISLKNKMIDTIKEEYQKSEKLNLINNKRKL